MVSIGPTIGIKGEKAFRASIREIISEAKLLDAQMDKLTATFEKNDSTMTKYEKTSELLVKQIDQQKVAIDKLKEARDKAADTLEKNTQIYEKAKAESEKLTKEHEEQRQKVERLKTEYGENNKKVKEAEEELTKLTDKLNESDKNLVKAETNMHNSGATLSEWERRIVQAEGELHNLNEELKNHAPLQAFGQTLEEWGPKIENVGEKLSTYLTAPLLALGTAAIKASSDFTDGMAKIYTIAFESAEPMDKMRTELIQLSNDTGFALDDLAEATYQTVSASVDATDAIEFMTQATKLARAGFTTTTKSVDILTTILNSYGKETYDVAYINDVLLKTQNDGKLIIDELASSLGMIIPLASNYNVGLEQVAAAYATMTKQGVPATKATTFLRAVFTELEKESSDVAKILDKETGKSFAQLMGEGKSLSDVLGILYKKVGGNAEKFQRLFGNVRATQAVAALVTDDFKILDYELERVSNSSGQTDKALEVLETNSLKAKRAANQLKNSAVVLGDTLIEQLAPGFQKAVDKVREVTDWFNNLTDASKLTIIQTGAMVAAAGPLIAVIGKVASGIGYLITNWATLMAAGTPLIAGFGALAFAIGLASAAAKVQAQEEWALREAEWGLNEATQANIDKVYELAAAHEEFEAAQQNRNVETVRTVGYVQELVAQYDALVESNGKVKEENQELANQLLNEIAVALGVEADQIYDLIDKNGKLSKSIQQTIEDYQKQAEMEVYLERLKEATQRLVDAKELDKDLTEQETEAAKRLRDADHELHDAKKAITDAENAGLPVTEEMMQRYADAADNWDIAKRSEDELTQAIRDNQAQMQDADGDIQYFTNQIKGTGDEIDKTTQKMLDDGKKARKDSKTTADTVSQNLKSVNGDSISYYMMTGLANGIAKYQYLAERAAAAAGTATGKALKNSVQVASPSKLTYQIGEYFVEGFANAIDDGVKEMAVMGRMLGTATADGLAMGAYTPAYTKSITAPISLNVTVNGNVDDPNGFAKNIADELAVLMSRESEVFA